jgi:hypothetical protein
MFVEYFKNCLSVVTDDVGEFILVKKIIHPILSTENVKRCFVLFTSEAGRDFVVWKKVFPILLA